MEDSVAKIGQNALDIVSIFGTVPDSDLDKGQQKLRSSAYQFLEKLFAVGETLIVNEDDGESGVEFSDTVRATTAGTTLRSRFGKF